MFDLYHAPQNVDYRQHELYEKIANDRLLKSAQDNDPSSTTEGPASGRGIIATVTDALAAVGGAFSSLGHRPSRI
jgi:hypothetical protein